MSQRVKASPAAGSILSTAIFIGIAVAQTPAAPPSFDVVSIRSADLPTPETMRSGQFRTGTTISGGAADFQFVTLADLLPYAYRVKSFQVIGPSSLRESRWNIRAKLADGASQDQVPEMVQAMLVDRFKLAIHHEKRELPVYELVVLKGGPRLEPAEAPDAASANTTAATLGPPGLFPFGDLLAGADRTAGRPMAMVEEGAGERRSTAQTEPFACPLMKTAACVWSLRN